MGRLAAVVPGTEARGGAFAGGFVGHSVTVKVPEPLQPHMVSRAGKLRESGLHCVLVAGWPFKRKAPLQIRLRLRVEPSAHWTWPAQALPFQVRVTVVPSGGSLQEPVWATACSVAGTPAGQQSVPMGPDELLEPDDPLLALLALLPLDPLDALDPDPLEPLPPLADELLEPLDWLPLAPELPPLLADDPLEVLDWLDVLLPDDPDEAEDALDPLDWLEPLLAEEPDDPLDADDVDEPDEAEEPLD
jgi:hypothetical protein